MAETTNNPQEPLAPESSQSPEVKRNHPGGRHKKGWYEADVQEVLNGSARTAARILQAHIEGKRGRRTMKASLQRACEYVIDHAIGKSRQKVEHTGGVMTYKQLVDSAQNLETSGREVLAEVEEIANKYQEKS